MASPRILFLAKTLAAALAAWGVWEVVLSNTVVQRPGYVTHPELGRIYKSGPYTHGTEGFSRTRINSLGFRDDWEPSSISTNRRILFLGDSFTEALQVQDGELFVNLVEKGSWQPVEAINAGRSGGSPAFYIHLRSFYETVTKPDQVVIQLNEGDFLDDALHTGRNFYIVPEGESFATVHNKNFSSANPLMQKLGKLRGLMEFSTAAVAAESVQFLLKPTQPHGAAPKPAPAKASVDEPKLRNLIQWTLEELQKYPTPHILYLPTLNYSNLDEPPPLTEREITAACEASKIPLVNMRSAFVEHFRKTYEPAHGFANTKPAMGHLNEAGHRLVARELLAVLKRPEVEP
ncbi:MAG: hypothetical protein ACO1QB_08955 [Verrucomicrobiales bacterium]